jgi:hypothetical protein
MQEGTCAAWRRPPGRIGLAGVEQGVLPGVPDQEGAAPARGPGLKEALRQLDDRCYRRPTAPGGR